MSDVEIRNALKDLEQIALAYTVKTSTATSPEQFLDDYLQNIKSFEEIRKAHEKEWMI